MKFKAQYTAFILLLSATAFAQVKDENIGTEVVNVVKPYTPTISDAFKVKETPAVEDEDNSKKADIKYNIFSFPVASTFTPSKGRAASVDKTPQEKIYKNFVSLALGNYGTINGELFVTENIGDNGYIGGMVRHLSSAGGIKEVELEDSFRNSQIDLTYGTRTDAMSWSIDGGYQNQMYNWYGLPQDYRIELPQPDRQNIIDGISPEHVFQNLYLGTKLSFNEGVFNDVSAKFSHFWDSYGGAENRFFAKPTISFDINDTKIKTEFIVDYVGGQFDELFGPLEDYKYGYTNIGVHPSFGIVRDDWSINLGAAAFYSMATEGGDSKFFVYPQVNASYKVVGDLMVFYAGAEGTLQQNSYRDLTTENPFIAPIQIIAPTDRQFDVFAGLKGKLANAVSYNVRASYLSERDKALFKANDYDNTYIDNYDHGNSFGVVYDDVRTITVFGELNADFSKNVSFGINGSFFGYNTADQPEAWNLPTFKLGSSLDVNITPKWYAGAQVFFVGERKDAQLNLDNVIAAEDGIVTVKSYFDANFHLGYKHNDRLTGFLKLNNIANQQYERWLNYPVQGIQVLLGASYKFDF
ncbi:TonB-dependent receptor [Flavobacterium longum]|uniref:TonB-dependent receptor n=1 Tax=Flavobacterium longum TaxID=1299340 RepID=UPI0039E87860